MGLGHSPSIIPDGLVFYFDPINTRSYAGTGLTGFNLIDTSIVGSFTGGAVFDLANKGSVYFDGSNDYINIPDATALNPTTITISCWVKFATFTNNANVTVTSASRLLTNKYYFLTATYDGTTLKLYRDGIQDVNTTASSGAIAAYATPLQIGRWGTQGSQYFNGNIASVHIYNRALSAAEILQNYNVTKKRFSPEENIVKDGLVLNIDAGNNLSYPGTGITALNIAGVGATGVLINGVGFGVSSGGSFIFDGTNDYIDCGTDSITNFATTTMSAEIMFQTTGATNRPHLIGRGTNGAVGQFVLILETTTPPKMRFYLDTGSGWTAAATGNTTIQNNQWYHAVGVYNGSNVFIYVNGVLDVSSAFSGTLRSVPSDSVTVGFFTGSSAHYLTGKIPFARLYNKALSSTEILQNYNALKGRYGLS